MVYQMNHWTVTLFLRIIQQSHDLSESLTDCTDEVVIPSCGCLCKYIFGWSVKCTGKLFNIIKGMNKIYWEIGGVDVQWKDMKLYL